MKVQVKVVFRGVLTVADSWTEEAIEADPDGFDDALLTALPDQLDGMEPEIEDAVPST